MARTTQLVCQFLEKVSSDVLIDYPDIIREYTKNRHGIYALYRKDRLYYVGLASNLRSRLKQHLKDAHRDKWDTFSLYITIDLNAIKELEWFYCAVDATEREPYRRQVCESRESAA